MKLQIRVDENGIISDVKFKTFGCGSAIASSSYMTERVKGLSLEDAEKIKNTEIAKELCLPPVKLHCSSASLSLFCIHRTEWPLAFSVGGGCHPISHPGLSHKAQQALQPQAVRLHRCLPKLSDRRDSSNRKFTVILSPQVRRALTVFAVFPLSLMISSHFRESVSYAGHSFAIYHVL